MYISSLRLRNYRNYENEIIQFINGMNILIGDNGEGKTNMLEAIYLLSTTRSHRNDDEKELIKFDSEFASVEGIIKKQQGTSDKLSIVLHKSGKSLLINNRLIKKNSEFIGKANAVLFTPNDMDLFDNSPKKRRRLVDMEIGKLSSLYMNDLSIYLKRLKERNNYLKGNVNDLMLDTLTELLYEPEINIIKERNKFVKDINHYISYFYNQISGENDSVEMIYKSIITEMNDENLMEEQLKRVYEVNKERDLYLKQTNTGIHREDYLFCLNGKEVNKYCSQGQKRMIILALKLAIVQIIYKVNREYPILLLDDVFSELDQKKRVGLMKLLPTTVQTIVTTTDVDEIKNISKDKINQIYVKKGKVEYYDK